MGKRKYLLMIGFWLFGFMYNYGEVVFDNIEKLAVKSEVCEFLGMNKCHSILGNSTINPSLLPYGQ